MTSKLKQQKQTTTTTNIPNFSLQEWKHSKMKMVEEYHWVITQVAAQSRCSQSGSSALKFSFQLVDHKYTEF
jgi:hypothetical protein